MALNFDELHVLFLASSKRLALQNVKRMLDFKIFDLEGFFLLFFFERVKSGRGTSEKFQSNFALQSTVRNP